MAGIAIVKILDYPKELTDKDWQKQKGTIGKMKKTGLGSELQKAEALHKKIDATKLDPGSASPGTKEELAQATKDALAYYKSAVGPLQDQLKKVVAAGKAAEATLKKMTGGGSAAKAAAAVAKAADVFGVTCKGLDLPGAVKDAQERIDKKNKLAAGFLNDSLKKFAVGAKAFLPDPTQASWESNIKQQGRSVSNSVKQLDAYNKKFWANFSKFQGFDLGTLKLSGDEDDVKAKRAKVVQLAMAQVKEIAAFKP